jgi:rhodanese-related sulfurtransferase/catechol 2,3-dioxygenase-like lactoylglutathione lyase family enzyme
MRLKQGYRELLSEAEAEVESLGAREVIALRERADVLLVDLREPEELREEGKIPGSFHAPRGNLEFWVDPESPYHRPELASGKRLVLYCAAGWRSALAAQSLGRMGVPNVCHLRGGLTAWKEAGGAIEKGGAPKQRDAAAKAAPHVTGLGGVFFLCKDPEAVNAWYREHLGLETEAYGCKFKWNEPTDPTQVGYTVWSPMRDTTDYLAPSSARLMLNYRVDDLDGLLAKLRAEGVTQVGAAEDHPNGRFAWVLDLDGNKLELWQPVSNDDDPYL